MKKVRKIHDRKESNRDLVQRMRAGESLTSFDAMSSWFPPRPLIKKDKEAMRRMERKSK